MLLIMSGKSIQIIWGIFLLNEKHFELHKGWHGSGATKLHLPFS